LKQIHKRLTYANVMSSIAVFLVLGGATAFAALGKNTVGSKQLKKNAVTAVKIKANAITSAKVQDGSLTGADLNLGTVGTVPSATNAVHAGSADSAKQADSATKAGTASAPTTLASGQTLRGHYHVEAYSGSGGGTGGDVGGGYSYLFSLPSTPTPHFIADGAIPPAQCPGTAANPQAAPGHLCVYESGNHNNNLVEIGSGSDKYGFGVLVYASTGVSSEWSIGSWAVTAP
jgi:hypothetical protein